MKSLRRACLYAVAYAIFCSAPVVVAQTETATVSGRITDTSGAVISGAKVELESLERGSVREAVTNEVGIYVFAGVQPERYHMKVSKAGFRQIDLVGLVLNVQEHAEKNFRLEVGSVAESMTVSGGAPLVNTENASVSTVVDSNFAENLPLNGRSFQTLIYLSPGVVAVSAGGSDSGQFSVNGQRAASNYWMVDGVSANVGSSTSFGGNQMAGAVGTTSVFGGTNSLVSVDALQEFRIQTSTFAPEYGRTPGAQISIVTRSGTNEIHGSLFDYLRNDLFDANNWFNGYTNSPPLRKAQERQNDFGGTFSGPIWKNRTFFFLSYEGLRLRLPTTTLSTVPDAAARRNAVADMKPFLNAFPLDLAQPEIGNGVAQFNASYSNPGRLDDYSLRVDHRITSTLSVFGRYNYSPSEISQRGSSTFPLSIVSHNRIVAQQLTIGSAWSLSPRLVNELRFNWSRTNASGYTSSDAFGNAIPFTSAPFPSPFTLANSEFSFFLEGLIQPNLQVGAIVGNVQRQFNVVDNMSGQIGLHSLKFGFDYRRLSPTFAPAKYFQLPFFSDVSSAETGTLLFAIVTSAVGGTFASQNLSSFAQDTWRLVPKLTITYGFRWDIDLPPYSTSGPQLPAVTGFTSLADLSHVTLAPPGTATFRTNLGNLAPRIGLAYQLSRRRDWETVARGGVGMFYDLATSELANLIGGTGYPFDAFVFIQGGAFPLSAQHAAPPLIEAPTSSKPGHLFAFNPKLKLPYTAEWNLAIQQGLGTNQTLSASYIGSSGHRLIQTASIEAPASSIPPELTGFGLVTNAAASNYNALQFQFERRMYKDLQTLASYTWSHSIDNASGGSGGTASNLPSSGTNAGNRGSSDFDVRHAFTGGLTYQIPEVRTSRILKVIAGGWSLQSILQGQSARPAAILDGTFFRLTNGFDPDIRPDIVPGIPLYIYGSQFPGGKAINNTPGAVSGGCPNGSPSVGPFCDPPADSNGNAIRQGTLGRNALRGFGLFQWDFGLHREFRFGDSLKLQFRAEMFNVLNHPNFAPPQGDISQPGFGLSTQMLGQYLSGGSLGTGGFSSLYQIGGPRSMQFALKLIF